MFESFKHFLKGLPKAELKQTCKSMGFKYGGTVKELMDDYRRVILVFVQAPYQKVQDFKDKLEKRSGGRYTSDNKGTVRVIVKPL